MLSFPVPGPASFPEIHPGRAARLLGRHCRTGFAGAATRSRQQASKELAMSETPRHIHCVKPEHTGARVTVRLQPEDHWLSIPRPKTSRQLLTALGLAEECALVARDGELLTPDRQIWPNDELLVRKVASVG